MPNITTTINENEANEADEGRAIEREEEENDEIQINEKPKIEVEKEVKYLEPNHNWGMLLKILSATLPPKEAKFYVKKIIKRVEQLH